MSVKVSSWVWHDERAAAVKGNELLALLALADVADDEGQCRFFESRENATQVALAAKARMSLSTFFRATKGLQERGLLTVVRSSRSGTNEYRIVLASTGQIDLSGTGQIDRSDVSDRSAVTGRTGQIDASDRSTVTGHRDVDVRTSSNARARSKTTIPKGFTVTDGMRAWAAEKAPAVNVERETESFVDYWSEGNGKGKQHASWEATWRTWMRRAQTSAEARGWKPVPASEVVEVENVTAARIAREKAAWLAAHGLTEEEFEANKHDRAWLARVTGREARSA